ncbi:MAG TPA: HAMP domain-containing sensor histidine kinase, partial [Polyangiaceae bacterium]|nr:HAMP domain-containing sensor histidine kinase [Polyangiaceae bacterium]
VDLNRDGDRAIVSVSDSGPGIVPEERERVYEPFFTTKPNGTGLGLTIVRSIVEAHHGDVFFESTPGEGTRVLIRLPAAPPASGLEAHADRGQE